MSVVNRTGHAGRPVDNPKPYATPTKLTTPAATTSAFHFCRDARWHPNGRYLAVVGDTSTIAPGGAVDYARVLRRDGSTFTDLGALGSLPPGAWDSPDGSAGISYGASWHPDGDHLAVGLNQFPYVHIYKRTAGETFAKLTDPVSLPTGQVQQPAYSPDGQFLACAHVATPFVTIHSRAGDFYTKLSNPGTLPAGNGISCAWSPDSQFLAVAHSTTPFVTIYQRSGQTFTKLTNPGTLPAGGASLAVFSPDGRYLAVGHATTPFLTVYRIDGTTFTKLSNPANLPPSTVREGSWGGPEGRHLFCSSDSSPFHIIYRRDSDTLVKLSDLGTGPTALAFSVQASNDGRGFLAVSGQGTPFLDLYQTGG